MKLKQTTIASLVVFLFVFCFEAIFHGFMLKDLYIETASLWRPVEEMKAFFPLTTSIQLIFSIAAVLFYTNLVQEFSVKNSLSFGAFLGFLFGVSQFSLYAYMPIPLGLAAAWFAGILLESVLIGLIMGLILKD